MLPCPKASVRTANIVVAGQHQQAACRMLLLDTYAGEIGKVLRQQLMQLQAGVRLLTAASLGSGSYAATAKLRTLCNDLAGLELRHLSECGHAVAAIKRDVGSMGGDAAATTQLLKNRLPPHVFNLLVYHQVRSLCACSQTCSFGTNACIRFQTRHLWMHYHAFPKHEGRLCIHHFIITFKNLRL